MNWGNAAEIAAQIGAAWSAGKNPGGAIIGFDARDIRIEIYGGFANLSTGEPFSKSTALRFASITKHLTAAAALVIQDQGVIDFRSPLSTVNGGAKPGQRGGVKAGQ